MMEEPIIDIRERHIINHLHSNFPDLKFKTEQLHVGDIIIGNIIIERKTKADLSSSIIDGRFEEQKARLLSVDGKKIIYIIEGFFVPTEYSISDVGCRTAIAELICKYGISVYTPNNIAETCEFIISLCKVGAAATTIIGGGSVNYADFIHVEKKKNVTASIVFLRQLTCIPSISIKRAKVISEVLNVKTMSDLMSLLLAESDDDARIRIFSNIDGIGRKTAINIYTFLFGK